MKGKFMSKTIATLLVAATLVGQVAAVAAEELRMGTAKGVPRK